MVIRDVRLADCMFWCIDQPGMKSSACKGSIISCLINYVT